MQTCKLAYNIGKAAGFPKKSQDVMKANISAPVFVDKVKAMYNKDLNKFWPPLPSEMVEGAHSDEASDNNTVMGTDDDESDNNNDNDSDNHSQEY